MALTLEEAVSRLPNPPVPAAYAELAYNTALYSIERRYGPEVTGEKPFLKLQWRKRDFKSCWSLCEIETVHLFKRGGSTLDAARYYHDRFFIEQISTAWPFYAFGYDYGYDYGYFVHWGTEVEAIITPKAQPWRDALLVGLMQIDANNPQAEVIENNGVTIRMPDPIRRRNNLLSAYQPTIMGDTPYSITLADQADIDGG